MKKYLAGALAAGLFSSPALAQNIQWKPIGPNAPQPIQPFTDFGQERQTRTVTKIGDLSFGSDGSRAYRTGNQAIGTDGSRGQRIGETTFLRDAEGNQIACRKYGENIFCD